MAVAKTSSFEVKLDRLKIHSPPSKQNANDKTAPIRANVFIVVHYSDFVGHEVLGLRAALWTIIRLTICCRVVI